MFKRKSFFILGSIGIAFLIGLLFVLSNKGIIPTFVTSDEDRISKEVNADNMYDAIAYLSEQPRAAGTDGELRAVKYIEEKFIRFGYKTEIQEFPIYENEAKHMAVKMGDQDLENVIGFIGQVSGKVTAPLIHVGKGNFSEVTKEVEGKIALIEHGDIPYYRKLKYVTDRGAVGAIIYHNLESSLASRMSSDEQKIPAVGVSHEQGKALVQQLKEKQIEITIDVEIEKIEKSSYNVVAILKPKKDQDTGQIVSIGAHHDSVPGGPGANDDASGVSAVLELARIFAETPIDTEIRFLTFGSEERGLLGSYYYTSKLSQDEIERTVGHFQMDMVGASAAGANHPIGGLMMYTLDGQKNLVTDLSAIASSELLKQTVPFGQEGRSDHLPFHELGIPAALFIHAPLEPDYHKSSDTLDKISKEKLQETAQIIGRAVHLITSKDTPAIEKDQAVPAAVEYPFEDRSLQ